MQIPPFWSKAEGVAESGGRNLPLLAWGWSVHSLVEAKALAQERLGRMLERVRRGEPLPQGYEYGSRPIREEVIENFEGAVLTRNHYGSLVLNAERLLFLDFDVPLGPAVGLLGRLFGQRPVNNSAQLLDELRATMKRFAPLSFRLYQTAAGFRVLASNREFPLEDPGTDQLLAIRGVDPAFVKLCRAQKCFRARLTPKPWRCGYRMPPGQFPREEQQFEDFSAWLNRYEAACSSYATCQFLEEIGPRETLPALRPLILLHDKVTRCQETLPLA